MVASRKGWLDELHPASKEKQWSNRWARSIRKPPAGHYMDGAIQSDSKRPCQSMHIDFLGSWLDKVNKLTNKGVHAGLNRIEAVKSVFHTYLVVADLLDISNTKTSVSGLIINKSYFR